MYVHFYISRLYFILTFSRSALIYSCSVYSASSNIQRYHLHMYCDMIHITCRSRSRVNVCNCMYIFVFPDQKQIKTRWWFQIFFIFTPIWGRFPFWLIFFDYTGWNLQLEDDMYVYTGWNASTFRFFGPVDTLGPSVGWSLMLSERMISRWVTSYPWLCKFFYWTIGKNRGWNTTQLIYKDYNKPYKDPY